MSAVRYAVLGFLLEKPSYPYELSQIFNKRIGPAWRLNHAAISQTLDALEREGLAERLSTKRTAAGKHESTVYGATERGKQVLSEWYPKYTEKLKPFRDHLLVKIALARTPDDIRHVLDSIDRQVRLCANELNRYAGRRGTLAPVGDATRIDTVKCFVLMNGAVTGLRAEIDWLKDTRERLERFLGMSPSDLRRSVGGVASG